MAKKKRKPERKKPPRRTSPPADVPGLIDRRAMEAGLRDLVAGHAGQAPADTPLARAQNLIYQAFESPDEKRRVQLAEEALRISPDCADAHVLLAEHAATRQQALEHYQRGVAAGERALGPDAFRDDVGRFWGILETRPYMRAREGLAHALWTSARHNEAIAHLQDVLRLNPRDNQGVRYVLASFLLFQDRNDDLARLLAQFPDEGSASWAYTRAILAFRQQGDTEETRRLLKVALKANRHVPDYLLGVKYPPAERPPYYSRGDENEAIMFVQMFLPGWKSTIGAIAWLRANVAAANEAPTVRGPNPATTKRLKDRLPRTSETWEVEARTLPSWVQSELGPVRPWMIVVTTRTEGLVLAHEITEEQPSTERVWDALVQSMTRPIDGEARRPKTIRMRPGGSGEALRPHLEEAGIALEIAQDLPRLDEVFATVAVQIADEPRPGLLDVPGLTLEQAGGFYSAAATFFQHAPWKRIGREEAIRVECERFPGGPWYAVIMGLSGLTMGVAIYYDLELLQQLWSGGGSDEENGEMTESTSMFFGEEWHIPENELAVARKHGWPVARPDAHPQLIHKNLGQSVRLPELWEVELTEVCLRTIPELIQKRKQDDPTREEFTIRMGQQEVKVALAWMPETGG